jgi:UDP-N-acetylglucosamine:LPS N-acetylglucosamine transferase
MLLSEDAYEAFREGIDKVRRPDAAARIADMVLKDIE